MKFFVYIFLFLFIRTSFAQVDFADTSWFDSEWKNVSKKYASFYRVYKRNASVYIVYDKYLNGDNQMIAEASQLSPLVKDGKCLYYYKSNIKESEGNYLNNQKTGIWKKFFDCGKDSSVYEVLNDGNSKYIRKSLLQKEEIYTIVEFMPEYPGGMSELVKFIQSNIKYPKYSNEKSLGGKALLKFVIDTTGKVTDISIAKSSGIDELDEEAIRVVNLMPKWKPGIQNGKAVLVYFNIPINFSMDQPFFVFNINNSDENYSLAKKLVISGQLNEAIGLYEKINGDPEVWYNLAVIYHLKKDRKESKEYFNKVIANISDRKNVYYTQSQKFLEKYY